MATQKKRAIVKIEDPNAQPSMPSGADVPKRVHQIQPDALDFQGDGIPRIPASYDEPQATISNSPPPTGPGVRYNVTVVDNITGQEIETLQFESRQDYEKWLEGSQDVVSVQVVGNVSLDEVGQNMPTSYKQTYAGNAIPDLPRTQADVDAFINLMKENNLFFGEGNLDDYPDPPLSEEDDVVSEELFISGDDDSVGLMDMEDPEAEEDEGSSTKEKAKDSLGIPQEDDPDVQSGSSTKKKVDDIEPLANKPGTSPVATTTKAKANIDRTGMTRDELETAELPANSGLLNRPMVEPIPSFKKCAADKVVNGKNNTWIVFGRDRPAGFSTGYGPGMGHTQAGAIDIVVGRMSPTPRSHDKEGNPVNASPIFNYAFHEGKQVCDAARIYISQKTDVDSNFKLADGEVGDIKTRSAVAMKADAIRIIARDGGIKLVTHHPQLPNSQGGVSSRNARGIDLIAGNDDKNLQPMVLGDNLVEMLREMADALDRTIGTLSSVILNLAEVDTALAIHVHPQTFPPGLPNLPSPSALPVCIASLTKLVSLDAFSTFAEKWQLESISKNYLDSGGKLSIRSSYNNLN